MPQTPVPYIQGQVPTCPHCAKALEDPIEDYVVPNRIGPASRFKGDCGWCCGEFYVERIDDSNFTLTPVGAKPR